MPRRFLPSLLSRIGFSTPTFQLLLLVDVHRFFSLSRALLALSAYQFLRKRKSRRARIYARGDSNPDRRLSKGRYSTTACTVILHGGRPIAHILGYDSSETDQTDRRTDGQLRDFAHRSRQYYCVFFSINRYEYFHPPYIYILQHNQCPC